MSENQILAALKNAFERIIPTQDWAHRNYTIGIYRQFDLLLFGRFASFFSRSNSSVYESYTIAFHIIHFT